MKKQILLFCITLLALGCNNNNTTESKTGDGHAEQHGSSVSQEKPTPGLSNGEKWKADSSTNAHVANLSKINKAFAAAGMKDKEDYLSLSSELQQEIENLVKGCGMKGEEHDALHKWLEPLMQMVKKLAGISSAEEGAKGFEEIEIHMKLYPKYFE